MPRRLAVLTIGLALLSCSTDATDPVPGPQFAIRSVGPETQVTTDPDDQFDPSISGPLLVYTDRGVNGDDVWVRDLVTGVATPVAGVGTGDQLLAAVSGNLVVFSNYETGDADIWMCEWTGTSCPAAAVQVIPGNQQRPQVFDPLIVWEDDRDGLQYDIYVWDLDAGHEVQITTDPSHQRRPRIFGTRIVWEDYRNGNSDVYTCEWDGTACVNERRVTSDPAQDVYPDVFGDWVVFGSNRASLGDIYAVNLAADDWTPIALTSGETYELFPRISGTYVAYDTYAGGNSDIGLFDLATGTTWALTSDPAEQTLLAISGTRVVYTDNRNGNYDIYMTELTESDVPAVDDIHDLVDEFVADGSISNSGIGAALQAFLDQVADAIASGDDAAACTRLTHFIDFVTKKSGKQIDASAAEALIAQAEALADTYCAG